MFGSIVLVVALSLIAVTLHAAFTTDKALSQATDFASCTSERGSVVMESYPRQCRTRDGKVFTEKVSQPVSAPDATSTQPYVGDGCQIGGCSNELCVDAGSDNTMSTCIWRSEYSCYKSARCEKQPSGHCAWTQTPQLQQCVAEASKPQNEPKSIKLQVQ